MNEQRIAGRPEVIGSIVWESSLARQGGDGDAVDKCCDLIAFLASCASGGIYGKTISAQHDEWSRYADRVSDLQESDKYTLRRVQ